MASRQPTSTLSTSGRATARPDSSRIGVRSRTSATAIRRSSEGLSRAVASNRFTSVPAAGRRAISKFARRHICSRRAIIGCRPRNVTSSSNAVGSTGPPSPSVAIQNGRSPVSSGRRNVSTSVPASGCDATSVTRRTSSGKAAAASAAPRRPDRASLSAGVPVGRARNRSATAVSGTATSVAAAAMAARAASRSSSSTRVASTWTVRPWRPYDVRTTPSAPWPTGASSRIL